MKTSILKPGLLVSLKTSIKGGVKSNRVDTEPEHETDEGTRRAIWETKKEITDPADHDAAVIAQSAARAIVLKVCSRSDFGLLAPFVRSDELAAAIVAARAIADQHNANATTTNVQVFCIAARIASDDAEAARAISAEVRNMLDDMRDGIRVADVEKIRAAANAAKSMGQMLSPDVAGTVSAAIVEARAAARSIVARVSKAGERAADVIAQCSTSRIETARFAFLDMDENATAPTTEAPAARGIDLETAPMEYTAAPAANLALEF